MIIDPLLTILKPPPTPQEIGSATERGRVGGLFGEVLPGDYMKFIELYGTGSIARWLGVLNPFAANGNQNLLVFGLKLLASLRTVKTEFPDDIPYPLFYEPNGLLPWGTSIDGDIFCWSTCGLSGHWTVTIIGRHTGNEDFPMSMTQFLFQCLSGNIRPRCVPDGLEPTFVCT